MPDNHQGTRKAKEKKKQRLKRSNSNLKGRRNRLSPFFLNTPIMSNPKRNNQEVICNCDAEFKSGPCPIHQKDVVINRDAIVTDENLVKEHYRRWEGLVFTCPKCSEDSIMDFSGYCGACGAKILIQSKILTDVINKSAGQ